MRYGLPHASPTLYLTRLKFSVQLWERAWVLSGLCTIPHRKIKDRSMTEISVWHTGRTAGWSMWQWVHCKKKKNYSVYMSGYTLASFSRVTGRYMYRTKLIKLPPTCPLHLSFLISTHISLNLIIIISTSSSHLFCFLLPWGFTTCMQWWPTRAWRRQEQPGPLGLMA